MGFLQGKRALIVGLATDRSIAWGIAQAMHREGAQLAFSHIARMADRVVPLAKELGSDITFEMDVASDEDIERGFAHLKTRWDAFDILVHAVAFAPREALTGTFIDATTRDGFRVAHDISSYSLTALARESLPFMKGRAGAIVTLSYLGALRSLPGYPLRPARCPSPVVTSEGRLATQLPHRRTATGARHRTLHVSYSARDKRPRGNRL
jgi:enoyl-[acyl-carrier protein] reductase I